MNIKSNIPNVITVLNLVAGFIAILINDPVISPILILSASILDLFDGLTAQLLDARSVLGEQLDSLADLVSFGVAPAFLFYSFLLDSNWYSLIIISFFPAMGALRLAKFNISSDQGNSFKGLPVPGSGLFLSFMVFALHDKIKEDVYMNLLLLVPLIIGLLMVSSLRMISFKYLKSKPGKEKILLGVLVLASLVLFILYNFSAIPVMVLLYVLLSLTYIVIK